MAKVLTTLAGMVGAVALLCPAAHACGDKFLLVARSGPWQMAQGTGEPGAILIYWAHASEERSAVLCSPDLASTLERAGHTVVVAEDLDSLRATLGEQGFDLVLTDGTSAHALRDEVAAVSADTTIVPCMAFPTRAEYSRAKAEFGVVVKAPSTSDRLLWTVAQAMAVAGRADR